MNRFGSNSFENENDQFADNQRIGRQLAENNPRPWNETYDPERTYQGRHHSHPGYRSDYPSRSDQYYNRSAYGNEPSFYAGSHQDYPANDPAWRHHDDRIWSERNDYKDSDYRYRSGHRNFWHEDYDDKYEANRHPHRRHPESFIEHLGEGIREGWNNLVHPRHERERYEAHRRERMHRNELRHWPNAENYPSAEDRSQRAIREEERREDEMRRRQIEQESRRHGAGWHNAGPNHHDEDFFDSRNFRL
ncbi:hypothetical protein [Adhaeribacter terreus]|uniref:Uncharacterized protein n=1 Tax=Adhaeribacter terreus TaxID=529703 RepID=A0ABW0EB71_9BACT